MSTEPSPRFADATLSAAASVASLMARVAGFAAGSAAIALFIGWRDLHSYFHGLGAPWVVEMLPPTRFMQTGSWLMFSIALFAWTAISLLAQGSSSAKSMRLWSMITGLLGLFFLAPTIFSSSVLASHAYASSVASTIFFSFSVGLAIGEIVATLAEQDPRWDGYLVSVVHASVLIGMLIATTQNGSARASKHLADTAGSLSKVTLAEDDGRPWYLVTALDGSFLLMSPLAKPKKAVFRVVPASSVTAVQLEAQ